MWYTPTVEYGFVVHMEMEENWSTVMFAASSAYSVSDASQAMGYANQVVGGRNEAEKGISQRANNASPLAPSNAGTGVEVDFSEEALEQARLARESETNTSLGNETLSEEEEREVRRLQQRDAEVRQHEQAHVSAGGAYVRGGANLEYAQGPDGKRYAVGGEVSIDVSPESTPEATVRKMQIVRRAALAPADPSPQDRQVAAQASQAEQEARADMVQERQEQASADAEPAAPASAEAEEDAPSQSTRTSADSVL